MIRSYDNLRGGSRARLAQHKAKASEYASNPRCLPETRAAYAEPGAWRRARPYGGVAGQPAWVGRGTPGVLHLDTGALDHLRNIGATDGVPRYVLEVRGYYCDAHASETIRARWGHLPARRGAERWAAWIEWSDQDGITMLAETFDSAGEAARAADHLAERTAETEREYSERWQAARELDEKADDAMQEARAARVEFRRIVAAWREQRAAGGVAGGVCDVLRERAEALRDTFRDAIRTAADARAELAADYSDVDL
jgi:hypothetical protein